VVFSQDGLVCGNRAGLVHRPRKRGNAPEMSNALIITNLSDEINTEFLNRSVFLIPLETGSGWSTREVKNEPAYANDRHTRLPSLRCARLRERPVLDLRFARGCEPGYNGLHVGRW